MLRNLFCIFVAVTSLLVLFPVACVAMLIRLDPAVSLWIARRGWAPLLLWAGGARLVVEGEENVDPRRPTIYASNHQSTIDIPVLLQALPINLRFIAKSQLQWVPIVGWYLWLAGHIFVDRANTRRAIGSLERAARRVQSGISIIVFPEGTRSPDGRVRPFKRGPFALALKAGAPICPITIEGSGKLMPKNSWNITPGTIRVKIGRPIASTDFHPEDREALARAVRSEIITQSLEMGGLGGNPEETVATRGLEGVAR